MSREKVRRSRWETDQSRLIGSACVAVRNRAERAAGDDLDRTRAGAILARMPADRMRPRCIGNNRAPERHPVGRIRDCASERV